KTDQLKESCAATEKIIASLEPGSRFVVIPITEKSFSERILLDAQLTKDPGLFGERVKNGKRDLMGAGGEKRKSLTASAAGTEIFGAVAKAAIIFKETPKLRPVLIFLSDMRHVARGYDFEKVPKIDAGLIEKVAQDGLIPPLKGVKI